MAENAQGLMRDIIIMITSPHDFNGVTSTNEEKVFTNVYIYKYKAREKDEHQQRQHMSDCMKILQLIECWLKCLALPDPAAVVSVLSIE